MQRGDGGGSLETDAIDGVSWESRNGLWPRSRGKLGAFVETSMKMGEVERIPLTDRPREGPSLAWDRGPPRHLRGGPLAARHVAGRTQIF